MITLLALVVQASLCAGAYWLLHTFPSVPVLGAAWPYIMYAVIFYFALSFIALVINSIYENETFNSFTKRMGLINLSVVILAVALSALICVYVGTSLPPTTMIFGVSAPILSVGVGAFLTILIAVLGIAVKDKIMHG
ncbi:hypothetical protein ACU9VT_005112 [Escherichia coli]|nr:hypothetical protein [Salmonella enterica]EEQ0113568.1 hypothetical protein [Salmonella enterica]